MENAKEILMTAEGLSKLESELEQLKVVRRKEVAEKIKQALAFGDLSENSEYDEAKNEQAQVEARIAQIEGMLKLARVVDESAISTDAVGIGTRVKLLDVEFEDEEEYSIVGSSEADPSQNRLSYESPVGKALIGKKVGDIVDVDAPAGKIQFKILEINR
ncbi:MAG: transcription elongation factor GreA [Ruminococcaceae bacterium]|nr:transcription elongation factor GreA [Oscillospiraceae bacterium]